MVGVTLAPLPTVPPPAPPPLAPALLLFAEDQRMAADPSHQSELVVQMVLEGLGLAQALSLPGSILQVPNHLHLLLPLLVYQRRKVERW